MKTWSDLAKEVKGCDQDYVRAAKTFSKHTHHVLFPTMQHLYTFVFKEEDMINTNMIEIWGGGQKFKYSLDSKNTAVMLKHNY